MLAVLNLQPVRPCHSSMGLSTSLKIWQWGSGGCVNCLSRAAIFLDTWRALWADDMAYHARQPESQGSLQSKSHAYGQTSMLGWIQHVGPGQHARLHPEINPKYQPHTIHPAHKAGTLSTTDLSPAAEKSNCTLGLHMKNAGSNNHTPKLTA